MNDQEFKQIRKDFDELATKELDDRGPSYAENEDRLANFKALGRELGLSPMQVLMVYLKKHMRSIERYVRDGHQTSEGVITNFVGARNYIDLAMALMKDSDIFRPLMCKNCGHDNPHQWRSTKRYTCLLRMIFNKAHSANCPKCSADVLCEEPECYCQKYEIN